MNAERESIFTEQAPVLVRDRDALPWTLIGAALSAMAALYFSSGRFVGLPVLAILLVLSRLTTWRLPKHFIVSYGSRAIILVVLVTLINQTDPYDVTPWYLKQVDTNLAGYALAADIVLRAWSRRDAGVAREGLGVVVLMTALLFAAATNTYERVHIQLITPIYVICLLLALRSFAMMQQSAASPRTKRPGLVLLRSVVIIFTLGFAFGGVYAVTRYENQVTNWAARFIRPHRGEQHEIGFAASPYLSTVFDPEQSSSRAFLIDGQISDPHMRIAVFNTYRSPQWLPLLAYRAYEPFVPSDVPANPKTHLLKFTRLADTADLLAAPLTTAAIHSDDPLERGQTGMVRDTRAGSFEPYEILDSTAPTFQGPLSIEPDEQLRRELLAIPPEVDPKVTDLARQVAGSGEQARQIFRIQEYLRSHNAYSMRFEPQGEPLSDFILNHRGAHCQYFASAVAIMARAIGVPSRYVGGFYAHELYGDGQTVVRQRDAHAWAECWLNGIGWVTVDATPANGRPDGVFPNPPAWKRWWEKLTDLPGEIRDWLGSNLPLLMKLAAMAVIVGFVIRLIRLILRRRRPEMKIVPRYPAPNQQLIEMAQRFDRWMNQRGIACPPQVTWRAHFKEQSAPREKAAWPFGEQAQLCDRFVRTYDRARFGSDEDQSSAQAQELLNRIEQGSEERYGSANR